MVRRFLLAPVLAVGFLSGCTEQSGPPVISALEGDTVVSAGDTAEYTCSAWDWGLKPIAVHWSTASGRFLPDTGPDATWFAPGYSGAVRLRVSVSDEEGFVTPGSLDVRVRRDTAALVSEEGGVKAGSYRRWSWPFGPGFELYGQFAMAETAPSVTLLVLDDANLGRWQAGEPFEYLALRVSNPDPAPDTFRAFGVSTGRCHLLLDSRSSAEDRCYRLTVNRITP